MNEIKMKDRWVNEYKNNLTQYGLRSYGSDNVYRMIADFLDGHGDIEDWGGGLAYFGNFCFKSKYTCVDGTKSIYCDKHVDLEEYTTEVDCILLKSVLEHNYNWKQILSNAIRSFKKRMVLVIYTPFTNKEEIITVDPQGRPNISFAKKELETLFGENANIVKEELYELIQHNWHEHHYIYYLDKNQ